jgi:hypothetical protein
VLPLALASVACGDSEPRGSIMLAISTDLYIDKDLSRVDVIVQPENGPLQSQQFNLAPALDGKYLPGTFAIVEGSTPGEFVRVRIIARKEDSARVVREAALRVPRRRQALLSMPIQWLCDGHVRQEGQLTRSNCDENLTCVSGACAPDAVDETALPDYEAEDVFGGGNATGNGTCFDTVPCFVDTTEPALDLDSCVLDTEVSQNLNVGIRLPVGSPGHCNNAECWVPIDGAPVSGWTSIEGGQRVQLPAAVCQHVRSGAASIRVSHECATKSAATPTCGPWTLVGSDPTNGGVDGAPLTVDNQTLTAELQTASQRLARSVAVACAAIAQTSPPAGAPTPVDVTALCDRASAALAGLAPLDWYHSTTRCWPDHARQLACEAACDDSCDPGTVEERCEPAAVTGTCGETCDSRQCLGSVSQPVDCPGACDGTCSGRCDGNCVGECTGTCATVGADGHCAGQCEGSCVGLCQGRCEGSCQGSCDGDPNLPAPVCAAGSLCRGGCAGDYQSPVCNSPLSESSCALDAECAADCRAIGHIGVACEPSTSWLLPRAGVDAARGASIGEAIADLLPVRDVQGAAMLEEARRLADNLSAGAASSGDPIGSANALVRVRAAVDLLNAATSGAIDVVDAAGTPRDTPGAGTPNVDCNRARASGTTPLIDDFEDGNTQILVSDSRNGYWHIVRDNSPSGQLSLDEPPVPESGGANDSERAMHLAGSGYTEWGAGFSVDLRSESLPYDASAHTGLKFWARGTTSLRLVFVQQNLATGHSCATCPTSSSDCGLFYGSQVTLTDDWTEFTVPWTALTQAAAGATRFAPDQLMLIKLEAPAAERFEFWLDDVSFF